MVAAVGGASIAGGSHAVPTPMEQRGLWDGYFREHYGGNRIAERVWASSGISTRHGVVDPRVEDLTGVGTGARMRRFCAEALPLGKEAVGGALAAAGLDAAEVGLFGVVSCTGYATPGLDILLARDLGMTATVQRLHIGHMGCYAALPGLGAVADFTAARRRPAVLLCLELTTLHVQPPTRSARSSTPSDEDLQQMVCHALFSDAAAAVALRPDAPGLEVVDLAAHTDVSTSDHMTWDVTDLGFKMGLSPRVPDVLAALVPEVIGGLLHRHGLTIPDVAGWAVHPGGRRILEVVEERLGLPSDAMSPSYDVLRDFGNCSSSTVLLVIERLLADRPPNPGEPVVAMAFGPGLTLYAALLRRTAG